ncbi:hypothetical protein FKM82_028758 [Ascaphus truei]
MVLPPPPPPRSSHLPLHPFLTSSFPDCHIPHSPPCASSRFQSFALLAPLHWNMLPHHIQSAPSLTVYRSQLKTHHFSITFHDPPLTSHPLPHLTLPNAHNLPYLTLPKTSPKPSKVTHLTDPIAPSPHCRTHHHATDKTKSRDLTPTPQCSEPIARP